MKRFTLEEQRLRHNERARIYKRTHKHPCPDCGKIIGRLAIRCRACSTKARWQKGDFRNSKFGHQFGQNHPNWKGGRYKSDTGYIYIYNPDYPIRSKRRYIAEHLLIWEQAHGKPLPKGWIIHHLNGIKTDNRSINLVALPNRKHYLILEAKARRIQELEALLNGQHQLL